MSNRAVFLDRDGTIIHDYGYIKDPEQVVLMDNVKESLQTLKSAGFLLIVISNQSGIARGLMNIEDVELVNKKMLSLLGVGLIDDIMYCPHAPSKNCSCRKPRTLLVELASQKYNIDLKSSYVIGDKDSDKELGINMGGTGIKIGANGLNSLSEAVNLIVGANKN